MDAVTLLICQWAILTGCFYWRRARHVAPAIHFLTVFCCSFYLAEFLMPATSLPETAYLMLSATAIGPLAAAGILFFWQIVIRNRPFTVEARSANNS